LFTALAACEIFPLQEGSHDLNVTFFQIPDEFLFGLLRGSRRGAWGRARSLERIFLMSLNRNGYVRPRGSILTRFPASRKKQFYPIAPEEKASIRLLISDENLLRK